MNLISGLSIPPDEVNPWLISLATGEINQRVKAKSLLLRPQIGIVDFIKSSATLKSAIELLNVDRLVIESAEINFKYQGYIDREQDLVDKMSRLEYVKLKVDFDYSQISSLSSEAKQKLSAIKPSTLGQAARISGVSPSDISVLLVYIGR